MMARRISDIVVQSTNTPIEQDLCARDIDRLHRAKGWSEIGFHFLIRQGGEVEVGRHIDKPPAAFPSRDLSPRSAVSIGLVGSGTYTANQQNKLARLIRTLEAAFPDAKVSDLSVPAAAG